MRVPLSWLGSLVDVSGIDPHELADRLSMTGTKVESIITPGRDIAGIVVAEVKAISPHPNADNLSLVDVATGEVEMQVVCGAKNFTVGDKVPFARVGSHLPGLEIGARKIRGVVSEGMLCSGSELGISKDHSGLLILQPDAPLGADVSDLLHLKDTILEFEITPNRPDCMSVLGIAREVSALYGCPLVRPEVDEDALASGSPSVKIDIHDPQGCPRYMAVEISGLQVGPSPAWMASRLLAAGVRPISNVVDATNYVLMELGQPTHAFDASLVTGRHIIVRRAAGKETLTTLDDAERLLSEDDLVIADPDGPIALAGVMGGARSEVAAGTTDVILEVASFDRSSVALTARRHALRTEASARFERGVDVEQVPYAAARCAEMICELAGGAIAGSSDAYPAPYVRPSITLRPERTERLLGIQISPERQAEHLSSIELPAQLASGAITVEVPGFRPDIEREADLIEEVARLEGFEALRSTVPSGPAGSLTRDQAAVRTITRVLASRGATEAWTSSFLSESDLDALGLDEGHPARRVVRVSNPMVEHEAALRSTMMPGLIRSVARNAAQRAPSICLFEIARIYEPTTGDLANEEPVLGMAMAGHQILPAWDERERRWDFFAAKGMLEAALSAVGAPLPTYEALSGHHAPFHPTRAAAVLSEGKTIGVMGEVHPDVCRTTDVPEGTVIFEIALAPVLAHLGRRTEVEELPRFPSTLIDLAVVVDHRVAAGKVSDIIRRAGEPEVVSVRLFDLYEGEQIGEAKKSLAFSLEMRAPDRTMTDEEALKVRDRIVGALSERVGAEMRG